MASFSSSATGQTSGKAILSGVSTVDYDRTVYIDCAHVTEDWFIGAGNSPSSSYTATASGLDPGKNYTTKCTVLQHTTDGSSYPTVYSSSGGFTTDPPSKPSVSAEGTSSSRVEFSWSPVTGATRYYANITTSGYEDPGYITGTSFSVGVWEPNTQICAEVSACGPDDCSSADSACASSDYGTLSAPSKDTFTEYDDGISASFNVDPDATDFRFKVYYPGTNTIEVSSDWKTTPSISFRNLDSGTDYELAITCSAPNYNAREDRFAFSTEDPPPPPKVATPELTGQTLTEVSGGFELTVNYQSSDEADSFTISLTGFTDQTDPGPIGGATFSTLDYGSSYDTSAKASKSGYTDSNWSDPITITTPGLLSTPSSISYNDPLISEIPHTINFSGVSNATSYRVEYSVSDNSTNWSHVGYAYSPDTHIEHTPTIDMIGKSIRYRVRASASGYVDSDWRTGTWSLVEAPSDWQWTLDELKAFEKNGTLSERAVANFTWERWNSFVNHVDSVISWYNATYGTTISSVTSALMTSSDKTLTAQRFNTVRFGIGVMKATGITDQYSNNPDYPVLGEYFITLGNKINEVE